MAMVMPISQSAARAWAAALFRDACSLGAFDAQGARVLCALTGAMAGDVNARYDIDQSHAQLYSLLPISKPRGMSMATKKPDPMPMKGMPPKKGMPMKKGKRGC